MSNTETATAEKPKYAPLPEEDGAAYTARLKTIKAPNTIVLKAANIVARAMELGVYNPRNETMEDFGTAINRIASGLKVYDSLAEITTVDDEVFTTAAKAASRIVESRLKSVPGAATIPRDVKQKVMDRAMAGAKDTIMTGASGLALQAIQPAITDTWSMLKDIEGLTGDNVPASTVVNAFKEDGKPTPLSRLVKEIDELRGVCRKVTHR